MDDTRDSTFTSMPLLTSQNYSDWVDSMKAFLITKSYWWIITGQEPCPSPSSSPEALAWDRSNAKAGSLIFLKLDAQRRMEFKGKMEHGDKLWKELEAKFLHKDSHRRFTAYGELLNVRKKPEEDMDTLTGRISSIMARVQATRPVAFTLEELDKDLHRMAILNSLKDDAGTYSTFTSSSPSSSTT